MARVFMRDLGALCQTYRKKLSCRQRDVAQQMHVTQTTVSKFERGENDSCRLLSWYVSRGLEIPLDMWHDIAKLEVSTK